MRVSPMILRLSHLLFHVILIWWSWNSFATPPGGMLTNWNRKTLRLADLCFSHCWRSAPVEIREPCAVYAIGYLPDGIAQLHIFDASTWTIVPSGAEVPVGQRDGTRIQYVSFLGLPDASLASNVSIRKSIWLPMLNPRKSCVITGQYSLFSRQVPLLKRDFDQ